MAVGDISSRRHSFVRLLLMVVAIHTAAAAGYDYEPDQHPCKEYHYYSWVAAELSDAHDEEATQALPQALVAYGWRKHTSGACSYKGHRAPCPERDDYHKDRHHFDSLFPRKPPQPNGERCADNRGCCSRNCVDTVCVPPGFCSASPPEAPANSDGWDCPVNRAHRQGAAPDGTVCVSRCQVCSGGPYPTAVCSASVWSVTGACCPLTPPGPNAALFNPWQCSACVQPCEDCARCPEACRCEATCKGGGGSLFATCNADGSWQNDNTPVCNPPYCGLSATTRVFVKAAAGTLEVPVEDVRVGDQVLCVDGGKDLMTPGSAHWCEVKSFTQALPGTFQDYVRINFTSADGTKGSTTVFWMHMMHPLDAAVIDNQPKETVLQVAPYESKHAFDLQPGQKLTVATTKDTATTFSSATIDTVEFVEAIGKYKPAIEHPYIVADGLVVPLWSGLPHIKFAGVSHTPDRYRAANALAHVMRAPAWMTAPQVDGTPAHALPSDKVFQIGRHLSDAWNTFVATGEGLPSGVANFTKALEWFQPLYEEWKADRSKAISADEVMQVWTQFFVEAPNKEQARPEIDPEIGFFARSAHADKRVGAT